jgi:hypothetical protein
MHYGEIGVDQKHTVFWRVGEEFTNAASIRARPGRTKLHRMFPIIFRTTGPSSTNWERHRKYKGNAARLNPRVNSTLAHL